MKSVCKVPGCEAYVHGHGYCSTHYAAAVKAGTVVRGPCSVDGCRAPIQAKGLCLKHYKKMRRYGSTNGHYRHISLAERYDRRINRNGPIPKDRPSLGACWQWLGGKTAGGYGILHLVDRSSVLTHRFAYEREYGPIPDGLVIDHLCRNRGCVNPAHLEAVTNEENLRRGLGYRLRNGMDNRCIHGHLYDEQNTYINPNDPTDIKCRACRREADRARAKRRAA